VQAPSEIGDYRATNRAAVRLVLWTLAWAVTLALARFGPEHLWDSQQPVPSWIAVAANLVVGIGWIIVFARFLREVDELQRKILQDALAVTLGAGWVGGFGYVVADAADLVDYDVNVAVLPAFLGVVYLVAFVVGKIRY
jgi:hypothetical protein